jgi:solute carrier family 25 (mitochondrial carnitine/acylcarnitine transporter), member 20/29
MLDPSIKDPTKLHHVFLHKIWVAGAIGGLASWVVSAPSELIKCRTQLHEGTKTTSLIIFKHIWKTHGLQGVYLGGAVTGLRDSVGYGFYFSSYELCRRLFASQHTKSEPGAADFDIVVSGGIAGIITWASIYPLDVIKTRIQAEGCRDTQTRRGLVSQASSLTVARKVFKVEGLKAFYRGLTICSMRAFFVNAIQVLHHPSPVSPHMLTPSSGTLMRRSWDFSLSPKLHD